MERRRKDLVVVDDLGSNTVISGQLLTKIGFQSTRP